MREDLDLWWYLMGAILMFAASFWVLLTDDLFGYIILVLFSCASVVAGLVATSKLRETRKEGSQHD